MYCIYIRKRKNAPYCTKKDAQINLNECFNCSCKEYKMKTIKNENLKKFGLKKNNKIAKLEKNRESILTNDLEHCLICGMKKNHLHEVFEGRNRIVSMKYNCVIPLCFKCHLEIHNNRELALLYKKRCQLKLEENMTREEFIRLFDRNYLD